MKITKTGKAGIEMIKAFEGFRGTPYKCSAGVPTIGYGATFYPGGKKVTMTDAAITEEQAVEKQKAIQIAALAEGNLNLALKLSQEAELLKAFEQRELLKHLNNRLKG